MKSYIILNPVNDDYLDESLVDTPLDFKTFKKVLNSERKAYNECMEEHLKLKDLLQEVEEGRNVYLNALVFKSVNI